jgi:hypothetical protein
MRLWSLHPKYLDSQGLLALWRESLLAQKVLKKETGEYSNHPQLARFKKTNDPETTIASYLQEVCREGMDRGYKFDISKIGSGKLNGKIPITEDQLKYELKHLKRKLKDRCPDNLKKLKFLDIPEPHPLFYQIPGPIESWEKIKE